MNTTNAQSFRAGQPSVRLRPTLGTGRSWRRRLLLHHVPLAAASIAAVVMLAGLPGAGPIRHVDLASGAVPQQPAQRGPMDMGGDDDAAPTGMDHDSDQAPVDMGRGRGEAAMGMDRERGRASAFSLRVDPGDPRSMVAMTVATGYVGLGLIGLTLLIGPANLVLRRRIPVSTYLRRDIGAWAAIASVVHVILGLQQEKERRGLLSFLDFFVADGSPLTNSFGWGNWTGLAALVIVVVLLVVSTDRSVREIKARRWKNLQRLNYALLVLVVAHAFFYGAFLRMASPFTRFLIVTVAVVCAGQATGFWLWRRRFAATGAPGGPGRPGVDGSTRPLDVRLQGQSRRSDGAGIPSDA